jgi:LAO/AO transport system kinase
VGVGQSETAVADMVDLFMLLLLPGGGDELQGIKKGIVELADLIVVNKADGPMIDVARHAVAEYRHALALLRPPSADWRVPVLSCSAVAGNGIAEVWQTIEKYRDIMTASGDWATRRAEQAKAWMWNEIAENLMMAFRHHIGVRDALAGFESAVTAGEMTPTVAAQALLKRFLGG